MQKQKRTYTKETLLVYLINELSNKQNYEVTTILDDYGCWTGNVEIKSTLNEEVDDDEYYKTIAERMM